MKWLLEHAASLNFGVSIAQLVSGLVIGLGLKPELVRKGKFGEWTFGLWTSQWLFFSLIYLVLLRYPYQRALLLLLLDIQSLLVLACAAILLLAEPLKIGRTLITIAILLFAFGIYNFFLNPWNHDVPSAGRLLAWTLPSQTLSLFSLYFAGVVICLRYRSYGFCFLVAAIIYSVCEQALYSATFIESKDISQVLPNAAPWFLAAAILKVIVGSIFYFLCFLELSSYPRLLSPEPPTIPQRISENLQKTAAWFLTLIFGPLGLAILAALLVEILR